MGARGVRGVGRRADAWFGFWLAVPSFAILAALMIYPLAHALGQSLFDVNLLRPGWGRFVGVGNYLEVLGSRQFARAFSNTVFFTVVSVALELVLGFALASLLARIVRFRGVARASLVTPLMLAPVVTGFMWRFMLSDQYGLVNHLLVRAGLLQYPVPWLSMPDLAMYGIIAADVWQTTPFMMLILLAGLLSQPQELFEAAQIDGASGWQQLTRIKLPLLQPVAMVALLIRGMDAFRIFGLVFVMTYGGPANRTDTLSLFIYRTAFTEFSAGEASAAAFVMVAVMVLGGLVMVHLMGKEPTS